MLGKEFGLSLLRAVAANTDAQLEPMLSDLQLAEFIYEQPAAGDIQYTFKHALTLEVAYNSILVQRRKQIHQRAAAAIEGMFAASLADHYDDLARHHGRSGDAIKAVNYLHLAAQQAMSRSAYSEAGVQLTDALELLRKQADTPERDRSEIAVRLSLAICEGFGAGGIEASANVLERARELSEKIGDDVSLFEVLTGSGFLSTLRLDFQTARLVYEKALAIALRQHDSDMVGHARSWLGYSLLYEGDFLAAGKEFQQAEKLSTSATAKRSARPYEWRVQSRAIGSFAYWALGYPQRATDKSKESLSVARESKASPTDVISALWWSAALNLQLKNWKAAKVYADEAMRLADEYGMLTLSALFGPLRGVALAQLGQIDQGLREMVQCRTDLMQIGISVISSWLFMGLAEIYLATRHPEEGFEVVGEGLAVASRTGTRILQAETLRLKGELLLIREAKGAPDAAAQCFRQAVEVARQQHAKSWELRAVTSLARLLDTQGRRDEARAVLSEIYNWFTEGFDTADLKDAKALLEQLNA